MPVLVLDDLKTEAREAVLGRLKGAMQNWERSQQLADVVELGRELPRTASGKIQRWMIEAELDQRWNALKNLGKKEEPAALAEEAPAEEAAAEEETPEE